jgi:acetyl esterase/lipase
VIVCPGGGYTILSPREDEVVAAQYLAAGFATFILHYSVKENAKNFQPLKEAALAIKYVRENAAHYNVDPDYVFIAGFSAGGHLAASAGVLWDHPAVAEVLGTEDTRVARPTGMILSYPVITTGEYTHVHSAQRLCGKFDKDPIVTYTREEADQFSLELHVKENTPPTFLWHTAADQAVPVENSLLFASALSRAKVPFELHIFPEGRHGLSLCNDQTASGSEKNLVPHNECWIDLATRWARELTV